MGDATDYEMDRRLSEMTYVGLFSAAPSDAGGGTELSGSGYARQAVSWTRTTETAVSSADITFENSGSDWPAVGWAGVFDASSAGNLKAWVALGSTVTVLAGRTCTIAAGDLEVTL